MVVCVCNAIREKDVREAARNGADTPCSAYAVPNAASACPSRARLSRPNAPPPDKIANHAQPRRATPKQ